MKDCMNHSLKLTHFRLWSNIKLLFKNLPNLYFKQYLSPAGLKLEDYGEFLTKLLKHLQEGYFIQELS